VNCVHDTYPQSFIALAGISAGSGAVVNYIGREGRNTPIGAAASLCPAWDLTQSFTYLQQSYPCIDAYLTGQIKKFVFCPENTAGLRGLEAAVVADIQDATYMNDFVRAAAPLAGCADIEELFRENNPMVHFAGNATPTLVLNALDDFLCVKENIRLDLVEAGGYNYVVAVTEEGSHIAYTEGAFGQGNYEHRVALDFFDAALAEHNAGADTAMPDTYTSTGQRANCRCPSIV
jgi:predicted alpha/beta-fold hydrolase